MSRGTQSLRVRAVASSWFAALVVACVALAALGGFVAYTAHAAPGSTDVASERAHWSVDGEFGHSADVTRQNPVFNVGATLSNRSTYFTNAAPVLDGRYVARYAGATTESASVSVDAALVVRSVGENTVYWTDRQALDDDTASVSPGESVTVEFSLNATEVAQRASTIQSGLGSTPGAVETFVAVAVDVEGTADGQPAALSFTHRLPVSVNGDTYAVGPAETSRETMTTTETLTTPREYGLLWSLGGPLLLVLGSGGLAGLALGRQRGALELSVAERRLLQFRDERAEFDEWVVSVRLPAELSERPRAEADSLSDLVDFAIDTDSGVLEDPDTGTFYAVGEELLVAYEPPRLADRPGESERAADDSGTLFADLGEPDAPDDDDEQDDDEQSVDEQDDGEQSVDEQDDGEQSVDVDGAD